METIRQMLIRHAEELAEALTRQVEPTPAPKKRRARGPVIVAPPLMDLTPEERDYVDRHVRRALGR